MTTEVTQGEEVGGGHLLLAIVVAVALAAVPLVPRTGVAGILGSGRFVYYLWTDFAFFGAAGVALLVGYSHAVESRLTNSLLALTVVQYSSLGIALLRGDQMTISYLGAGTTWIKAWLLVYVANVYLRRASVQRVLLVVGLLAVACALWLAWREALDDPVVKEFLNSNYGTAEHVAASESATAAGSTFRVAGSFDRNPHGLALFLMAIATGVSAAVATGAVRSVMLRVVSVFAVGFCFYLLMTTFSSLGALATVAALGVVALYSRGSTMARLAWMLPLAGAVVYVLFDVEGKFTRFLNIGFALGAGDVTSGALSSGTDRLEAWRSVADWLDRDLSSILFGVGPSGLVQYARERPEAAADSDYVFLWLTTGLLGVLVYLGCLAVWWRALTQRVAATAVDRRWRHTLLLWTRAVLVGMAVAGFAGPFVTSEAFARNNLFLWVLISLSLVSEPERG